MILNQEKTEKAKEFINNGNLLAAENILSGLEDKCSIFELAKIRKIQGRNMEAEKLYLKSLSMTSEIKSHIDSDINLELGRIYAGFGKVKEAQYRYGKGLDRISLENNIYRELGSLYLRTKEYEKAKENLEKAKKMFPNDIPTNFELAMLYRVLGKDDLSKTIFNRLLTEKEIKTNKFLYNKILNEYEILMKKEYLESKPREIRNAITTKCNASCRYCDVWKDNMGWSQNERVTKEVVDLFPYLESAHWLGGETFLYKGFEEILEEGFKYDNLTQTILTNGLLINEKILNKMAIHEFKCVDFIGRNLKPQEKLYLLGGNDRLAEIFITQGSLIYDYKVVVKNTVPLWCVFEDEEGDQYSLICLLAGSHSTNYNSDAPNITKFYVKGDDLENYQDLRLSSYDA